MLRGSVNSIKEEKRRRDERKELLSEVMTQLQETGRYSELVERASNLLKDDVSSVCVWGGGTHAR